MRVRTTRRGVRLVHGRHVVSELLHQPGPTHSVFDVLAAAVAVASPGDHLALLGFAGGGLLAPLRALGRTDAVQGVDLDLQGARLFRRVARGWGGQVLVQRVDAAAFLRRQRGRYPCVIEDLSMQLPDGDVQKPSVSLDVLPALIARRLTPGGVAIFNLLPTGRRSWRAITAAVAGPFPAACQIGLSGYENRILLAGSGLPTSRRVRAALDAALALIGSRMQGTLSAKTL